MQRDHSQPDLFGDAQPGLFDVGPAAPVVFRGDPDRVRARLQAIVSEAARRRRPALEPQPAGALPHHRAADGPLASR